MKNILLTLLLFSTTIFASSQAILKLDTKGHTAKISDILVTKSGDIISASNDKTIRVWDSKTGIEKRKILGNIGSGAEGNIFAIALSDDEKYLAVGGFLDKPGHGESGTIRIYNYTTGKLLHLLKSHIDVVFDLAFSKDNRYLISGSGDYTAKIWSIKNNFRLKDTIRFHTNHVYAVKMIKKDGNYFAITAGYDNKIALYDLQAKRVIKSHTSDYKLNSLAMSKKNGGQIATCGKGKEILIFDYSLNPIKTIYSETKPWGLAYSQDGKFLLAGTGVYPYNTNIYQTNKNYALLKSFKKHTNLTMAVNFLDSQTAISGNSFDAIYTWDINTLKVKQKIVGVGKSVWSVGIKGDEIAWGNNARDIHKKNSWKLKKSINIKNFKISNNPKGFVSISTENGSYYLKHSKGGSYRYGDAVLEIQKNGITKSKIIKGSVDGYVHRCYGWYKDFIISGGANGHLRIYNKEGKEIASLLGHTGEVWSIAVDGDKLVSGSSDQTMLVWDLKEIKKDYIQTLITKVKKGSLAQKYNLKVGDIIYGVDNKHFKTHEDMIEYNQKLQQYTFNIIRDKKRIKVKVNKTERYFGFSSQVTIKKLYPALNIFVSNDNNYVAYTNEGFFNASKDGAKYIGYHINQGANKEAEYVTVDALYSSFYRPDLIQKALNGESLDKYAKNINIQKLLKDGLAPEVHILTKTTNTKIQDLDLKVQVCPKAKGGYDNLTLLINDMPVSVINTSRALKLKKKSKRDDCFIYDQTISLAGGVNNIGFRATNKAGNIESKPDFLEVTFDDTNLKKKLRSKLSKISGNQSINDLHILAIAVNEYKDKDLTLKYSINDASVMLKTIQDVAKPLFNKVHTYKLFDKQVTKENIKQAFKDIKSTREDVFLLYIAGHGITDEYNGNYYYIPYDFINKDNEKAVQTQGVGQKDLMLGLSNITALKSLVLLDTCNSGSFVEANMQKTTTNRLARATGRATISASSKSQVALEGYKGHGVFTYTLVEALKGKGYNKDNKITINELNDYVEEILPDRTNKKWGYKQMPQSSMYGVDFNIGEK